MPAAAMSSATCVRSSRDPSSASVWSARGRARSRRWISTITPNAPNAPASSRVRSYPATFFTTRPPLCTSRPSPMTNVTPSRWSRTGPNTWRRSPALAAAPVGELLAQQVAPDSGFGRGGEVLGLDSGDLVEAAGGEGQVRGRVGGEPGSSALDAHAPSLFAGGAEQQRHGVGGGRRDAWHAVRGRSELDGFFAQQGADAIEQTHDSNAECGMGNAESTADRPFRIPNSALRTPDHSRQAWIGTTFPGFTRSSGSHTCRTARMAASESPSNRSGI